ncbi:MAG: hypothetical protein QFB86_03505 [Patescibacteria group bacterium]|nr:hypothetical protein [Patescibacteria group bacterium]
MNPTQNNESAGFNLPPVAEQAAVAPGAVEAAMPQIEHASVPSEQAPIVPAAVPPLSTPLTPTLTNLPQVGVVSSTTTNVVTNVNDEQDLIEKEWVTKAKKIVEANRDDPFKQSEELTVFRADYMQKRYNKSIKVSK